MAKPSLESCRVSPEDGFQCLSSYQNVFRWKNRNWWKKISNFFFLTNFFKGYFKAFLEKQFFSKKNTFLFFVKNSVLTLKKCQTTIPNWKKQVKVDLETRSYDFLTKIREKNPMLPNIRKLEVTLGLRMNINEIDIDIGRGFAKIRTIWIGDFCLIFFGGE